ncbi:MAG TPA: hypothetical protein VII94_01460 [Candidatus Saccharimonadales bacterium]
MKKVLLILLFFAFGYVVFYAPTTPPLKKSLCSSNACQLPLVKQSQNYAKENWQISLPNSDWEEFFFPEKQLALSVSSQELGYLIVLTKNETELSYNDFVFESMASIMRHGGDIQIIRYVYINGNRFIESQSIDEEEVTWMWITIKNDHSYILTCNSGIDSQFEICKSIAETLQIN